MAWIKAAAQEIEDRAAYKYDCWKIIAKHYAALKASDLWLWRQPGAREFAERVIVAVKTVEIKLLGPPGSNPFPEKLEAAKLEALECLATPLFARIAELEGHCKSLNQRLYAAVNEDHVTFGDRVMTGQEVVDKINELEAERGKLLQDKIDLVAKIGVLRAERDKYEREWLDETEGFDTEKEAGLRAELGAAIKTRDKYMEQLRQREQEGQ